MTRPKGDPADVAKFLANDAIRTYCAKASKATGVLPSVILAQWGCETAWGTSSDFVDGHNFAGISSGGVVIAYPNYPAGLEAYIEVLNLAIYEPVRAAAADGPDAEAKALGASPWAGDHYQGDPPYDYPGGVLVEEIADYNLAQFDALLGSNGPEPAPPPPAFSKLAAPVAWRLVLLAFALVLNRTPTDSEALTWTTALEDGTREPANLLEELTLEPQSFVSPVVARDAPKS